MAIHRPQRYLCREKPRAFILSERWRWGSALKGKWVRDVSPATQRDHRAAGLQLRTVPVLCPSAAPRGQTPVTNHSTDRHSQTAELLFSARRGCATSSAGTEPQSQPYFRSAVELGLSTTLRAWKCQGDLRSLLAPVACTVISRLCCLGVARR